METRTGNDIGSWIASLTLLMGLAAWSLPAAAATLVGAMVLGGVGALLVVVGVVNLRWALRLDGRDVGPTLLTTLVPVAMGGLLALLATSGPASLVVLRGLGVLAGVSGVLLLLPPPQPLATAGRGRRAEAAR